MTFNSKIPIAEINKENIYRVWPQLLNAIQHANLVAVDLEFSGLGDSSNKKTFHDRYKIAKETVKSRTILSMGIATFQRRLANDPRNVSYKCKIFDLLSLESKPFVADPEAFVFLSSHGFDFNRLFSHGIRYTKAATSRENIFKSIFEEILASGVSLAVHNGFNDLLFIYEHFYASLPDSVDEFVANIADWFGIVDGSNFVGVGSPTILDSKYLALKNEEFESSYLEYVFRKAQRMNHVRMETLTKPYVSIKFSKLPKDVRSEILFSRISVALSENFLQKNKTNVKYDQLCENYKNFGNCRKACQKEHDIDLVLDYEDKREEIRKDKEKRRRERKTIKRKLGIDTKTKLELSDVQNMQPSDTKRSKIKLKDTSEDSDNTNNTHCVKATASELIKFDCATNESSNQLGTFENRGKHRAGMDAFATGFSVLYLNVDINAKQNLNNGCLFDLNLAARLPLPGKEFPLLLRKPERVRQSESHVLNWGRIQDRRNGFLESSCNRIWMDSSTQIDRLKNNFLLSIKRSAVFSNLPLQIRAQISKDLLNNGNEKLPTDCCRFCGIKQDFETSQIQIIKRRGRRNKSAKISIVCQGCQKVAANPVQLPSVVSPHKKAEFTSKNPNSSTRATSLETDKKSNRNSSSNMLNVSHLSKGVARRTSKVNKLHLLALNNSKPICNSLSSFLKSFQ